MPQERREPFTFGNLFRWFRKPDYSVAVNHPPIEQEILSPIHQQQSRVEEALARFESQTKAELVGAGVGVAMLRRMQSHDGEDAPGEFSGENGYIWFMPYAKAVGQAGQYTLHFAVAYYEGTRFPASYRDGFDIDRQTLKPDAISFENRIFSEAEILAALHCIDSLAAEDIFDFGDRVQDSEQYQMWYLVPKWLPYKPNGYFRDHQNFSASSSSAAVVDENALRRFLRSCVPLIHGTRWNELPDPRTILVNEKN